MQSLKNRSIAGTAALIATVITIAAATPVRAEPVSLKVAYGDLDIASDAGRATLDARIARAARKVCDNRDLGTRIEFIRCRQAALANAEAQLTSRSVANVR